MGTDGKCMHAPASARSSLSSGASQVASSGRSRMASRRSRCPLVVAKTRRPLEPEWVKGAPAPKSWQGSRAIASVRDQGEVDAVSDVVTGEVTSLQVGLERILSEYDDARRNDEFGSSHPLWEVFTSVTRLLQNH